MLKELLPYYERELTFLRELSGDFAQRYPKIARRLLLDGDQSEDPHVERIIEAFAFLTARIHRKLDDEFPEITEAFLQVLYPHYIQPFPSCTLLQMELSAETPEVTRKMVVPRHHPVISPPVGGHPCQFRTAYDVDLWPLNITSVRLQLSQNSEYLRRLCPKAGAAITVELQTHGALPIGSIGLDRLRFFLDGDSGLMALLYELLLMHTLQVRISDGSDNQQQVALLPASSLTPVGFAADEGLLDYDNRSFMGYRLLSEYFAFPDKFLFVELNGLDHPALAHKGDKLSIQIFLRDYPDSERHNRLAQSLNNSNFKLGCTPAINLFRHAADPIRISHHKTTYPVLADARKQRAYEVVSIESVTCVQKSGDGETARTIPPFYSIQHHAADDESQLYWYATREAAVLEHDDGTDMEIAFVDRQFSPHRPQLEVLSLRLTCSNRDLPEQLPFGGSQHATQADFTLPQYAVVKRVRPLRKPTASRRPPTKPGYQWRLISHLSLNHLSIASQGKDALQEMLGLYNPTQSPQISRQIQGIVDISCQPATTRVHSRHFSGFVRGVDITLTLDENAFVGSGMVLFGAVLERFFALYCGPNNFTRLTLRSKQQEQEIAQWPARTGDALVI